MAKKPSKTPRAARAASTTRDASRPLTHDSMRERKPWVKPGEQLGYVDKLKKRDAWPPKKAKRYRPPHPGNEKRPVATPFVVVQAGGGDFGARPIPDAQAFNNASIQILDTLSHPVDRAVPGQTYRLRCRIWNRGAEGAYAGIAEFYVGTAALFNQHAINHQPTKAQGYAGFSAGPGGFVDAISPNPWTPATAAESRSSIVVQAYDPFTDRVQQPFDARNDRHVGRRDYIPDFSGIWDGMESANQIHQVPTLIRIVVTQAGANVNVGFYSQVSGGIPSTPQDSASGTIVNGKINVNTTEFIGGNPFTQNQWELSLTPAGKLHFEHFRQYVAPGDTRPDTHTNGDLTHI